MSEFSGYGLITVYSVPTLFLNSSLEIFLFIFFQVTSPFPFRFLSCPMLLDGRKGVLFSGRVKRRASRRAFFFSESGSL